MDGVIYRGDSLLPGVKEFVEWLYRENKKFLFLTNSSRHSPKELQQKLKRMGLDVDESHFYTSAMATSKFLSNQSPGCSVYAIGEPGLFNALYDSGITINTVNPDYVIVGETNNYNFDNICQAVKHVFNGAKLIGTNTDLTSPLEYGIVPACRALLMPIEATTGRKAILHRKTKSSYDAYRSKNIGCSFRGCSNDRRPYGHRYNRRHRKWA